MHWLATDRNVPSHLFCFLMSSILLETGKSSSQGKIFNEGDHLHPWFKIQELEVAREFTRQSPECSDVLEKVIVYRLLER